MEVGYLIDVREAIMDEMKKYIPLAKQAIFFGAVGIATLGIDILVSTFFYSILLFPAYLASGIGFLSGFFFNFPMNRKKVFHHRNDHRFSLRLQVCMYVALSIFNLVITSFLVESMVTANILSIQYAKIVVTILIAIWNFLLFKFLIFSSAHQSYGTSSNIRD